MSEIWRYIPGYPKYLVSDQGRVKSFKRGIGRILKAGNNSCGYMTVSLFQDGKGHSKPVHQLVAMAFLGHKPCGLKLVVNHKDFNQHNNRLENLEIVTQRENANFKHLKKGRTSQYTGVSKYSHGWRADISIDGKRKLIGRFRSEYEAHLAYQKELSNGL